MNKLILFLLLVLFSCSKKVVLVTDHTIHAPASSLQKNYNLEIRIYKNDTINNDIKIVGFGYDIYRNNALYIHQPNIPAVAGTQGFITAQNAYRAANLVANKIQNNIVPPSISIHDLDSIGALSNKVL